MKNRLYKVCFCVYTYTDRCLWWCRESVRGTAGQEKGRSVKRCCTFELGRGLCDHLVHPESKHTQNQTGFRWLWNSKCTSETRIQTNTHWLCAVPLLFQTQRLPPAPGSVLQHCVSVWGPIGSVESEASSAHTHTHDYQRYICIYVCVSLFACFVFF